jgi:hypothetical protein
MALTAKQIAILNGTFVEPNVAADTPVTPAPRPPITPKQEAILKGEAPTGPDGEWSVANAARQALGQGLALGAGDEVVGTLRGLWNATGSDQSYGDAISEGIDAERAANEAFEEENPWASTALQVGGGMLTGGVGAGRVAAMKGASLGAKALRGAKIGGFVGAADGTARAEGGLNVEGVKDRAAGGVTGLTMGAALGGSLPAIGPALKQIGKTSRVNKVFGTNRVNTKADKVIHKALVEDGIIGPQVSRKDMMDAISGKNLEPLGPDAVPVDLGGKELQDVFRSASGKSGAKKAQTIVLDRQKEQLSRISPAINSNVADTGLNEFLHNSAKARRASARKNYGDVYKAEIELDDKLKGFFNNKSVQSAYDGAKEIADVDGVALTPLSRKTEDGIAYLKPNMETLDYIKQGMDDRIQGAFNDGKAQLGEALKAKRQEFIDHLDEISPKNESGESLYKKARSEYAGASQAIEAAETGRGFLDSKKFDSWSLDQMGDHEKEAFLFGVAEDMQHKIRNLPDASDAWKKLFNRPLYRDRIEDALSIKPGAWDEFKKVMDVEEAKSKTHDSLMGSRTANMLADSQSSSETGTELASDAASAMALGSIAPVTRSLWSKIKHIFVTNEDDVGKRVSQRLVSGVPSKAEEMAEALKVPASRPWAKDALTVAGTQRLNADEQRKLEMRRALQGAN